MRLAWSWSRLNDFEKCPRMCYWKHVAPKALRCPMPQSETLIRGREVHAHLERSVQGQPLPAALAHVKPIVDAIHHDMNKGWEVKTECQLALREDLAVVGWFAKDVWCRVIYDVLMHQGNKMKMLDWKTGKVREEETGQLRLFAMTGFAISPYTEQIDTDYIWVDHKQATHKTYYREQFEDILQEFRERSEMIQIAYNGDGEWQCKPEKWKCDHCPCTKRQCEYARNEG